MQVRCWLVLGAAVVSGGGCSGLGTHEDAARPTASNRQILVMLKESPISHYRPGSTYLPAYGSGSAPARQLKTARDLARKYDFRLLSDWPMPAIGVRCFLGDVPEGRGPQDLAARLAADPRVESAQPVQTFHALGHDDPYYPLQTNAKLLQLDQLHRMATGRNVTVAEIDTGVESSHPDLEGQLSAGKNFVDGSKYVAEVHGTAVAGIIAAKADNGVGIVGVAPSATLMPLRACWQRSDAPGDALCTSFTLAKAIQYALIHEARVLNLSLAGPRDRLLERLIDKAIEQRITIIGAIDPDAPDDSFPATHTNVIAVAAIGAPDPGGRAILAPGDRVLTTTTNASWGFVSGSSFATAHVTGIAALLLERSPGLKPADIAALLHEHARQSGPGGDIPVLDACAALASVSASHDCHCCRAIGYRPVHQRAVTPPS